LTPKAIASPDENSEGRQKDEVDHRHRRGNEVENPKDRGKDARHGNGRDGSAVIGQVANEGKFVLDQVLVDPGINRVIEDRGIERKENFRGETGEPILEAKKEGGG